MRTAFRGISKRHDLFEESTAVNSILFRITLYSYRHIKGGIYAAAFVKDYTGIRNHIVMMMSKETAQLIWLRYMAIIPKRGGDNSEERYNSIDAK
jgi:hypothetical protein